MGGGLAFVVWGLGFGVWGLGFVVWGLGFVVCGLWFVVYGLWFMVTYSTCSNAGKARGIIREHLRVCGWGLRVLLRAHACMLRVFKQVLRCVFKLVLMSVKCACSAGEGSTCNQYCATLS